MFIIIQSMTVGIPLGITFGVLLMGVLFSSSLDRSVVNIGATATSLFFGLPFGVLSFGAMGASFGGIAGIVVGGVAGLIVGTVSVLWFYPPRNLLVYRFVTHLISVILITGTMYAVFGSLIRTNYPEPLRSAFALLPIALSSFGSYWVIQKMIRWYTATYFVRG